MQYVARVANSINVGRAGEFLVAAELRPPWLRGLRVDMPADYLLAQSASGKRWTLQFKASLEQRSDRGRPLYYSFTRVTGVALIFAYVALDIRLFILRTAPSGKTVRIKPAEFTPQAMADSIATHLY